MQQGVLLTLCFTFDIVVTVFRMSEWLMVMMSLVTSSIPKKTWKWLPPQRDHQTINLILTLMCAKSLVFKCWNISFNFSTWSTWLILISSSHLHTYLSKGTTWSVQYMVTIILQIEFECLESGAYKIRTNGANLRQDLLFGSDILDIGRVLE